MESEVMEPSRWLLHRRMIALDGSQHCAKVKTRTLSQNAQQGRGSLGLVPPPRGNAWVVRARNAAQDDKLLFSNPTRITLAPGSRARPGYLLGIRLRIRGGRLPVRWRVLPGRHTFWRSRIFRYSTAGGPGRRCTWSRHRLMSSRAQ